MLIYREASAVRIKTSKKKKMRGILTIHESQRSLGTSFVCKYGSQFYS